MINEARAGHRRVPKAVALAAALLLGPAACGDDPFSFDWNDEPQTVLLYSKARPELNVPSGFSFLSGAKVVIESPEATGTWDMALDTQGGSLVLLPPGALGVDSRARIAPLDGLALADVQEAPTDSMVYVTDEPVVVRTGTVYVVRTGQRPGSFGRRCVYYAKMEAVEIDVAGGSLVFRHVTNPLCNDRRLIPPD